VRYRFGAFLLDPDARVLSRGGDMLTLSPKVFDCVVYLVENRDRAVGHGELSAAVWGRADVLDIQLRQLIRKVRRTVGDDGGRQDIIRTVPHFGFHWVADVSFDEAPAPDSSLPPEMGNRTLVRSAESGVQTRRRAAAWSVLALITMLAISADDHALRSQAPGAGAGEDRAEAHARVAMGVLPVDVGGNTDPDLAWIRLGLMDLIATYLRSAKVSVAPSSEMVALDRGNAGVGVVAQRARNAIGARSLIQPSAIRFGGEWKVRLELTDGQGSSRIFEAQAPDVIVAARAASDRLLAMQGKAAASAGSPAMAQLLQRIEAAMLVDDFNTARDHVASAPPAARETPELQLVMARIDIATHRLDEANVRLTSLLDVVSPKDNPALRARILTRAGVAQQNQRPVAVRRLSEAIDILANLDEPIDLSFACSVRGYIYSSMRRFDDARADYGCARTAAALSDDQLGLARVDNNEAALELLRGHPADALPLLESAARMFERFGALDKMSDPLLNRITAHLELLQPVEALAAYRDAVARLGVVDDAEMQRVLRTLGAECFAVNGRLHEALASLDDVLKAADPVRESDAIVMSLRLRAQLELALGRHDSAIVFAKRSIETVDALGRGFSESAAASLVLVRALRGEHQVAAASAETRRISDWGRDKSATATSMRVKIAEAEEAFSAGRWQEATHDYEEALRIASADGTPANLVEVVESYGTALLDGGYVAQASVVVGRIGRWANRDFSSALLQVRLYQALGQTEVWKAALDVARQLAGERSIPQALTRPPRQALKLADGR